MAKKFDAVVTQRYSQNGEDKKRYINVGAVFEGEKGLSLKLDSIPVQFDGWINFYEPRPRDDQPAKPTEAAPTGGDPFKDDVPFAAYEAGTVA
jgi:hypothetical protein